MDCIIIALALTALICVGMIPRRARQYWEIVNVRTKEKRRI